MLQGSPIITIDRDVWHTLLRAQNPLLIRYMGPMTRPEQMWRVSSAAVQNADLVLTSQIRCSFALFPYMIKTCPSSSWAVLHGKLP